MIAFFSVATFAQDDEMSRIDVTTFSTSIYTQKMEHDEVELQTQEIETMQTPIPQPPSPLPPSQIIDPAPCTPERRFDGYFIPRYILPLTPGTGFMSVDVEGGWIWGSGSFFDRPALLRFLKKAPLILMRQTLHAQFNLKSAIDL